MYQKAPSGTRSMPDNSNLDIRKTCQEAIRSLDLRQDYVKTNGQRNNAKQHTQPFNYFGYNSNANDLAPPSTTLATQPYNLAWWNMRSRSRAASPNCQSANPRAHAHPHVIQNGALWSTARTALQPLKMKPCYPRQPPWQNRHNDNNSKEPICNCAFVINPTMPPS